MGDRIGEGRLLGEERNTSRSGKVVLPTEGDLLCWRGKILGRRREVGRAENYPRQMVENLSRFHASGSKFSQVRDGKYYPICKNWEEDPRLPVERPTGSKGSGVGCQI